MSKREMIKPFSWGLVTGVAAITIAAFSLGWVVTNGSRNQQVQAAWIDGQASICSALVKEHRVATGDTTDLSGYSTREQRETLAKTFAVALPGHETADPGVISACSKMLRKQST